MMKYATSMLGPAASFRRHSTAGRTFPALLLVAVAVAAAFVLLPPASAAADTTVLCCFQQPPSPAPPDAKARSSRIAAAWSPSCRAVNTTGRRVRQSSASQLSAGRRSGADDAPGEDRSSSKNNDDSNSWRPTAASDGSEPPPPPQRRFRGRRSGNNGNSNIRSRNSNDRSTVAAPRKRRREEPDVNKKNNDSDTEIEIIHSQYLATCVPGLADILRDELRQLGAVQVRPSGRSAVAFAVSRLATALEILLWCRTAHKILELLVDSSSDSDCSDHYGDSSGGALLRTRDDLYNFVRRTVPVDDLLLLLSHDDPNGSSSGSRRTSRHRWMTLSVHVTLNNPNLIPPDINHSHYSALNIKNALVDAARDHTARSSHHSDDVVDDAATSSSSSRPSVDTTDAVDVPLTAVLRGVPGGDSIITDNNNSNGGGGAGAGGAHCSLYRCLHAGSLHRRVYRADNAVHRAALRESTAAGLLRAADWHVQCAKEMVNDDTAPVVLVDPMMGSGTFLIEAAMMAADIAPGLMRIKCGVPFAREPPVVRWNHDNPNEENAAVRELWNELLRDATHRAQAGVRRLKSRKDTIIRIVGSDAHGGSAELARRAVQRAGLADIVELRQGDCARWRPLPLFGPPSSDNNTREKNDDNVDDECDETTRIMVVTNPPWGVRLDDTADANAAWESLRTFLRENCPGGRTEAWILSGSKDSTRHLGLRRSQMMPLQTGRQTLRWLQYEIRDARKSSSPGDDSAVQRQNYDAAAADDDSSDNSGRVVPWPPSATAGRTNNRNAPRSANTDALPEAAARKDRQDRNKPDPKTRREKPVENEWLI